jgi:DNA primase
MALFPQSFVDDLKAQADIVSVIGDVVPLRKMGATYKGLCPFHTEKTPSFNVNKDKGFFKCFGCGAGGDVIKFVELYQKISFPEAVRHLALRFSISVPETTSGPEEREQAAERQALLALHEQAAAFYREQLEMPGGSRARRELDGRALRPETMAAFGYGYAPASGRDTLHGRFADAGVPRPIQLKSGLVKLGDNGQIRDQFRNRLMIPIVRDTGAIVAFGGRALEEGQVPKYLNSPETPIYTKGKTLYGLNVTKGAVREKNYCVLVEGYFDLAQVWQAGVQPVVALCGTALTADQARTLKRFASKVVLSLDPDAAGQNAAARSSELLVAQGFQVNVALMPGGADPDAFIRRSGGRAYVDQIKASRPYLEFLIDRAAEGLDLTRADDRKKFLDAMLRVAATIPDAAERDQFADQIAHKARVTEGVIRDEIKKAAAQRKVEAPSLAVPTSSRLRPAEQGLLWALVHRPVEALAAIAQMDAEDLQAVVSAPILQLAMSLGDVPTDVLPALVAERLSTEARMMLDRASSAEAPAAPATACVRALKRDRVKRDLAGVQDAIDRLDARAADTAARLRSLWDRKKALHRQLEELTSEDS